MRYEIMFDKYGEETSVEYFGCKDVGQAFARCQKEHPGAVMKMARAYGSQGEAYGETLYDPPKVQRDPMPEPRPPRALKKNETGCEFPFYDTTKSYKP